MLPRFFCPRIRNRQAEESASGETYVFLFSRTRTQTNRIVDKNKRDGIAINERERERESGSVIPPVSLEEFKFDLKRVVRKDRVLGNSLSPLFSLLPLFSSR